MKVIYPNSLSRSKYIKALMNKYFFYEKEIFSPQQIEKPINIIVNALENEIKKCRDKNDFAICVVAKFKAIFDGSISDEVGLSDNFKAVFYYFLKEPENIKADLQDENIDYPIDNADQYLTYISTMTQEVIEEVIYSNQVTLAASADTSSHKRSRSQFFFESPGESKAQKKFHQLDINLALAAPAHCNASNF